MVLKNEKYFRNLALVSCVLVVPIIAACGAMAWSEPTVTPAGGTINAAVNTGSTAQTKSGGLNIDGNVGIGTTNPGTKLETAGLIKITGGNPGAGKVLISDGNGLASWRYLPKTCASMGHNCNSWPDGWGNTLNCGTCSGSQICQAGTCVAPPQICSTCTSLGKNCGSWPDGCGNTLNCGNCYLGQICQAGTCVIPPGCVKKTCASAGYECDNYPDGCGGLINCGTCPDMKTCIAGKCIIYYKIHCPGTQEINHPCSKDDDCCTHNCTSGYCGPATSTCGSKVTCGHDKPCNVWDGGKRIFVTKDSYSASDIWGSGNHDDNADKICREAAGTYGMQNPMNFKALLYTGPGGRDISEVIKNPYYYNGILNPATGKCDWKLVALDLGDFIFKDPDGNFLKNPIIGSENGNPVAANVWTDFRLSGGGYDKINTFNAGFVSCGVTESCSNNGSNCVDGQINLVFNRHGDKPCDENVYWYGRSDSRTASWAGTSCHPDGSSAQCDSQKALTDKHPLYCIEQ